MKKYDVNFYILLFFWGSILGWISEVLFNLIAYDRLVSPGVLNGPWCPIYGVALLVISFFTNNKQPGYISFIKIFLITGIDEYLAAFISEKFFNNKIWDYSNNFLNINGRVCLSMTILFTLLGLISTYIYIPLINKIYNKIKKYSKYINTLLILLFILDIFYKIIVQFI